MPPPPDFSFLSGLAAEVPSSPSLAPLLPPGRKLLEVRQTKAHSDFPNADKSGRHSDISQAVLVMQGEGGEKEESPIIVKRVDCANLPDRPAFKWQRDVKSYSVEVNFYGSPQVAHHLREKGVYVPLCHHSQMVHTPEEHRKCSYLTVLQDLTTLGFEQFPQYEGEEFQLVLNWLADFHSTFWDGAGLPEGQLWPTGSYWELSKREQKEIDDYPKVWGEVVEAWRKGGDLVSPEMLELFKRDDVGALGQFYKDNAKGVHDALNASQKGLALVHGDFKSANIWLNKAEGRVSAVDFQWSGPGKAARDLVYFLCGAGAPSMQASSGEAVAAYHRRLVANGITGYSLEELQRDFRLAFLDFGRILTGYLWIGLTPEKFDGNTRLQMRIVVSRVPESLRWALGEVCSAVAAYQAGEFN